MPAMFLTAPLDCFYLLLFGFLFGTSVLTTSTAHTQIWTYTAVRYCSINELAPLLDEDQDQDQEWCLYFLGAQFSCYEFGRSTRMSAVKRVTLSKALILSILHDNSEPLRDYEILCKLILFTNEKSHTGFQLIQKSVTLNDLEWRNDRHFVLILPIRCELPLR